MTAPRWRERFGAWAPDPEPGATTAGAVLHAAALLDEVLARQGAIELGPRSFFWTMERASFFERGWGAVVVDVEGLILRHPSPFPELDLFPRASRLLRRVRR